MPLTVVPFPHPPASVGRHGHALLEAARTWSREPGRPAPFPDATVRSLGVAGLLGALTPLDVLMIIVTAHAADPLHLGPPGASLRHPDAHLLAVVLDQAGRDGVVSATALDRLVQRVSIAARPLLAAALDRLAGAAHQRVQRAVWSRNPGVGWSRDHDRHEIPAAALALAAE